MHAAERVLWVALPLWLLCGCAASPTKTSQTYDTIEITLTSPDKARYFLVGTQGRAYGTTTGASGAVIFGIPPNASPQECYTVYNSKGKSLLKGSTWVYPSLRVTYRALADRRAAGQKQLSDNATALRDATARLEQARVSLGGNLDWQNNSCERPPQEPIPPEPTSQCESRDACLVKARGACVTRFLKTEFCSLLYRKVPIGNVVICKSAMEHLDLDKSISNEQMGTLIFGALLSAITSSDEKSDEKSGSKNLESLGDLFEIVSGLSELSEINECASNFVERDYGPRERWNAQYGGLQTEADRVYQSCIDDQSAVATQTDRLTRVTLEGPLLAQSLSQMDLQLRELKSRRDPLQFCSARTIPTTVAPRGRIFR
ncbi:MAG TPA: hypothetical protein VGN07_22515 [Steroidobacteraceae bacterium]|jgi:hypothetical protein